MPRTDFSISPYGRGYCPACGGEFNLTKAGVMRHHDGAFRNGERQPCGGVRQPPRAITLPSDEAFAAMVADSKPADSIADRRRRLEADAEDAKKALWNAQRLYDRICNELAELRHEEMGN